MTAAPHADAPAGEARYRALEALSGSEAVAAWVEALSDESWRVRRLAVDRLAEVELSPELLDAVVALLRRRDEPGARGAAVSVLSRLGARVLPLLEDRLRDREADQRKLAADLLGALRRPEAAPALVAALEDADANVRAAAAEALGQVGGFEARVSLEGLLRSSEVLLRVCALEALTALRSPPSLALLAPQLSDPLTRRSAWRLLGHVPHLAAVRLAIRCLRQVDSRDAALLAFAHAAPPWAGALSNELASAVRSAPDGIGWLTRSLEVDDPERHRGAVALTRIVAAPALAWPLVRSVRPGVDQRHVVEALALLGTEGARVLLGDLTALLELPAEAKVAASEGLIELAAPSLASLYLQLLDSGDPELCSLGIRALARCDSADAIVPLARLLEDDALAPHAARSLVALAESWPAEVRAALEAHAATPLRPEWLVAWAELVENDALETVQRALHDPSVTLRVAAARSARFLGDAGRSILQAALLDETPDVRRAAVRALPNLESNGVLLSRALRDAEPSVLAVAATVAGVVGAVDEQERLLTLTRHADAAVVLASMEALSVLRRVPDEVLLRGLAHPDAEVVRCALDLGAERAVLVGGAIEALEHPRWEVRVAAARLLSVASDRESLPVLQEAVLRERDAVARGLMTSAADALLRRT